jgi:hypothetical protein
MRTEYGSVPTRDTVVDATPSEPGLHAGGVVGATL